MLKRVALGSSIVMVPVTLARVENPDWGNFWHHGWYHLFVVVWLVVVTHAVRTIGGRELVRFWLMGFFPVALLAYLSTELLESQFGTRNLQNGALVPLLEESIKFLPLVLWTTWLRPKHLHGTLSDFLLLGFTIGAGFSLHEDALYARVAAAGFGDGVLGDLFPSFLSTPTQFAIAHAGWTAISGVGVGLVSLHRHRPAARLLGVLLIAAPIVDHAAVNWSGSGSDFMNRITGDGDLAAALLVITIVGAVVHDVLGLRWAARRDGTLPLPRLRGDLNVLTGPAGHSRIGRLAALQRYRRRRNAAFIDLFAVRSLGGSAGNRWRVRSELQVLARRTDADAVAAPAASAPIPIGQGAASTDGSLSSRRTAVVGLVVVVLVAGFLMWRSGGSGGENPVADVINDQGGDDPVEVPGVPATGSIPGDSSIPGPIITEPVLLRWQFFDESGPTFEEILAADGDRQLWASRGTLYYQDGGNSIRCDHVGTEAINCFAEERTGSLVEFGMAGYPAEPEVPGIDIESDRIAGRDVTCVSFTENETSTRDCRDDESGLQLLLEKDGVTIVGGRRYSRTELVEWSTPSDADFAIPPEAQVVLDEASGEGGNAATPSGADLDNDAGSNDGNGNGGAPEDDLEQLVADLEPPNSSGTLSRSTADGIIYISWETSESLDDLQGLYDDVIADAGYTISSRGSAGVSYEWIFGNKEGSNFRGVVTVSPGNGGSIVAAQVGSDT